MNVVLLLSGGTDSVTLLYRFLQGKRRRIHALAFDYGQTHQAELRAARHHCARAGVPITICEMPTELFRGSALTGSDIEPKGEATIVPNRNAVFIMAAAALAMQIGYTAVAIGCNRDDAETYPDCRPQFIEAMQEAIRLASGGKINLFAPFLDVPKTYIVTELKQYGVDVESTVSCYRGEVPGCGCCGACIARDRAISYASQW